MTEQPTVVFGAFPVVADLLYPIDSLLVAGFPKDDLSLLVPESLDWPDYPSEIDLLEGRAADWPYDLAPTAFVRPGIEASISRLVGFGKFTIPGLGPIIAAGPIVAALAGLNVDGGDAHCAASFVGLGMPSYEAGRYEYKISRGGSLLSILCENTFWDTLAMGILIATGAEDVSSTGKGSINLSRLNRRILCDVDN